MSSLMRKGLPLGGGVAMHPGHYLACIRSAGGISDLTGEDTLFDTKANGGELANHPVIRGIQVRFPWVELETSEGVYDFSNITKYLNLLKLAPEDGGTKYLMVLLEFKSFSDSYHVVPAYMRDGIADTYGGGEFAYVGTGYAVRFDNVNVQARFAALAAAFGAEFANEDQIEMVSFTETSIPNPDNAAIYTAIGIEQFIENCLGGMLEFGSAIKAAMPRTIIRMMINSPRQGMQAVDFVDQLVSRGIQALGAPDTFSSLPSYMNSAYTGFWQYVQDNQGVLVMAFEVQRRNFYFDNNVPLSKPANGWIADCTVSDNGAGKVRLTSATVLHGYSTSVLTDTTGAKEAVVVDIVTTNNGFTAGEYEILTVVSTKAIDIDYPYSGSLTGPPTTMQEAPIGGGYPYAGSGAFNTPTLTFIPNANTYQGCTPTIQNLFDLSIEDMGSHYMIWSRNDDPSVLNGGEMNYIRVYKWLNDVAAKKGIAGGLNTTRPTSIS